MRELWPLISKSVSAQYLKSTLMDSTKLCICIDIDKVWVGIVRHQYAPICNWVMTLYSCKKFILLCFHSIFCELIDEIWQYFAYALILTRSGFRSYLVDLCKFFLRVMAFDSCQISFPCNILRIDWIWQKFAYALIILQDTCWDCYASNCANL